MERISFFDRYFYRLLTVLIRTFIIFFFHFTSQIKKKRIACDNQDYKCQDNSICERWDIITEGAS